MAVMTIRDLDDGVRDKLRVRAALNKHSMEAEVREILARAVASPLETSFGDLLLEMRGILDGEELELPERTIDSRDPFA